MHKMGCGGGGQEHQWMKFIQDQQQEQANTARTDDSTKTQLTSGLKYKLN